MSCKRTADCGKLKIDWKNEEGSEVYSRFLRNFAFTLGECLRITDSEGTRCVFFQTQPVNDRYQYTPGPAGLCRI